MSPSSSRLLPQDAPHAANHAAQGTASARADWTAWLLPLFALACWALAIRHLSTEWTANEQYHFGWLVPLLAAYLVKVRCEQCPAPARPPARWLLAAITGLLALAAALAMPVREANLDWRLIEWSLVAVAIASSFLCAWQAGGLAWVRHFTFPILFFLIAVPLPRRWEDPWMQWLMRKNATIAVEILRWFGVDGQARGNLIQLPECTLGVDEACSGIRSLQGTLMLTLFLGEILGFRWSRRLVLFVAGIGAALVSNIARTTFLGLAAARSGHSAIDEWHDTAGFTALATASVLVILIAWAIHPRSSQQESKQSAWSEILPGLVSRLAAAARPAAAALTLVVAALAFTQYWFLRSDRALVEMAPWTFRLPDGAPDFRETEIGPETRKTLNFDEGYAGQWQGEAGLRWQAFYFQWLAGRNAIQTQGGHTPRNCLGAVGLTEVATLPPVKFARGNVLLSFDAFHFQDGARNVFVFNCLAEDVRSADEASRARGDATISERLKAALAGRRQAGQRRLEVAVWDAPDAATAMAEFEALLERQMQVGDAAALLSVPLGSGFLSNVRHRGAL